MPALFTTTSSRPNRCSARLDKHVRLAAVGEIGRHAERLDTGSAEARDPLLDPRLVVEVTTTRAPAAPSSRALANPIPVVAARPGDQGHVASEVERATQRAGRRHQA